MLEFFYPDKEHVKAFLPLLAPELKEDQSVIVLGAVSDDKAVGVLAFSKIGERALIRDIRVSEKFKRRGIGTALINYLCDTAALFDCFSVNVSLYSEQDKEMISILRDLSFNETNGPEVCEFPVGLILHESSIQKSLTRKSENILSLDKLMPTERRALDETLRNQELIDTSLDWNSYDPKLSFAAEAEGDIVSIICLSANDDHCVIEFMYADSKHSVTLMPCIAAAADAACKRYGEAGSVRAVLISESAAAILGKLTEKEKDRVIFQHTVNFEKELFSLPV